MSERLQLPAFFAALLIGLASASAQAPTLTEAQAVALAAQHDPSLRAALLTLRSAQMTVEGEEARYDPLLVLDAGLTRIESPFLVPGDTLTSATNSGQAGAAVRKHLVWGTDLTFRLGGSWQVSETDAAFSSVTGMSRQLGPGYGMTARLTLAQPLLRGFGRDVALAELDAARARMTSAERTRESVASELLRDVLAAYWELWAARVSLAIQEQSSAVAERQRDEAIARVETGSLSPAAALTFETRVATRAEDVLAARTELQRRRTELRRSIGVAAGGGAAAAQLPDPPDAASPGLPVAPPPDEALQLALAESSTVRERAAALALAEVQAKTSADPLRSRLDLEAYLQADGLGNNDVGAAAEGLGTLNAVSAHVGLVYETPFTSTRLRSAAARARLDVEAARARVEEAQNAVAAEVENALTQLHSGRERLALAERTVQIAAEQLAAEQARLATGGTTPLAVVEAEDEVRAAQLRIARAQADLAITSLTLEHLTGRLLARHAGALDGSTAKR